MAANIEEIKKASRIEELVKEAGFALRGHGRYLRSDEHDSLIVDTHNQAFYWNSKSLNGDVIAWVEHWKRTDFKGAVEFLARHAGMEEPQWSQQDAGQRLAARAREDAMTVAGRRFIHRLWRHDGALAYARARGWTDETIKEAGLGFTGWNTKGELDELRADFETAGVDPESPGAVAFLGYEGDLQAWAARHKLEQLPVDWLNGEAKRIPPAPKGMLVYPHVGAGRVVYVSYRSIEDKRHMNPREVLVGSRQPYFNRHYSPREERCVVVEGQADAITLAQWGLPAVGLAGVSGDGALLQRLREHKHLFMGLDQDEAGETAGWPMARALGPLVRLLRWPEKDANDWLKAMLAEGLDVEGQAARMERLMAEAPPLVMALGKRAGDAAGVERDEALKVAFLAVAQMSEVDRAVYRSELSQAMGLKAREFEHVLKTTAKDLEERGRQADEGSVQEIVGGHIKGWLVELLYDPQDERTFFAYRSPDGEIGTAGKLDIEGIRYLPMAPNSLITRQAVVLPSALGPEKGDGEITKMLGDFIHRYYDIDPFFEKTAAYYVMLTWVFDSFQALPYLRALGEFGSGKTQLMIRLGHLCYRLIKMSGAASEAAIFRTVDLFRGTLFIDEADQQYSDESATFVKILNTGNQKGMPVWRMADRGGGQYDQEAFDVFGPKLITTRQRFKDEALESRCLTIEVLQKSTRELVNRGIPLQLTKAFYEEAAEVRNVLLRWRLGVWQPEIEMDESEIDDTVQARLNQVIMPLKQIVKDPVLKEDIKQFVRQYNQRMVTEMSMSLEAKVLEALIEIQESEPSVEGKETFFDLSLKNVARVANAIIDRENIDEEAEDDGTRPSGKRLTPRGAGSLVKNRLNLPTERASAGPLKGNYCVKWDDERIAGLRLRYGL